MYDENKDCILFGKYKNQPLSSLLGDKNYCDWLKKNNKEFKGKMSTFVKSFVINKMTIDQKNKPKSVISQKQKKQNIRQILEDIGIQSSVKQYNNDSYEQLRSILLTHPNAEKLQRIQASNDLEIYSFRKIFHMNLIFDDGSKESVSWNKCAVGQDDTNDNQLNDAMRNAIHDQIKKFQITHPHRVCELCKTERGDFHVDHHQPLFVCLKKDFLNTCNIVAPTTFGKDGYYTCIDDSEFKNLWKIYHQEHATLRWLCTSCNLSRKK